MLFPKQKNLIPFERYQARKKKQPDYLCNLIKKNQYLQRLEEEKISTDQKQNNAKRLNQRRIQYIKKTHKSGKITDPDPYVKRTWLSPLQLSKRKQYLIQLTWKKVVEGCQTAKGNREQAEKVCKILNINKKLKLFGQYLYYDLEQKETCYLSQTPSKENRIDILHKQYSSLMKSLKANMVVCNKSSQILKKKKMNNPLGEDKYFKKIIKQNDENLIVLLLNSLCPSSSFTFTSYIQFYQIFVWQTASKKTQIQFVLNLLMQNQKFMEIGKVCEVIDFICSKIYLEGKQENLQSFNQIMKKLMFGKYYEDYRQNEVGYSLTRENIQQSLMVNEECISIFINVFYSE